MTVDVLDNYQILHVYFHVSVDLTVLLSLNSFVLLWTHSMHFYNYPDQNTCLSSDTSYDAGMLRARSCD